VTGDDLLLVRARSVLLDALQALRAHRPAVIVIGAQAIYLRTGRAQVALAETTKDSDLAIDARTLEPVPLLEVAMRAAGFRLDEHRPQPGTWLSHDGVPVDLMVPATIAGDGGRRGSRIPPHSNKATRRAAGLEAAVVDHVPMIVRSLDAGDARTFEANVAGPAALLIAKLHKLGERQDTPGRLVDKDAHDLYRLLLAVPTEQLAQRLSDLLRDDFTGPTAHRAMRFLADMFASGPSALGSVMAGRAEEGIGNPAVASASVSVLARELLDVLTWQV
jgi:hypothetical protein